jgi:hypothetical protein
MRSLVIKSGQATLEKANLKFFGALIKAANLKSAERRLIKMKKLFQKAVSVLGGFALVGATISGAVAATYPSPFDSGSYAVVYGSGSSDSAAANTIANGLPDLGGTVGVSDESVKIERSSDKFNLGDTSTSVFASQITSTHLPTLLTDGTYRDADNDEFSFRQKIDLASWSLGAIDDSNVNNDEPTVGVTIDSRSAVLNYTLYFSGNKPTFTAAKLENTNLKLFGKEYFVLDIDASTPGITLLDSAKTIILNEGDEVTVDVGGKSYTVAPSIFGLSNVKITVNGETTNSLSQGSTYKLSDGTYVGVKELVVQNYQGGAKQAEVSIGSGKLIINHGQDVQLNDESVLGLKGYIGNTTTLNDIVLEWKTSATEEFLTSGTELVMPGFETLKVSMTGMNYPSEETIVVENDGSDSVRLSAPIKDGTAQFNLLYSTTGTIKGLGKSSSNKLLTSNDVNSLLFNVTNRDTFFVASWNSTREAESYLLSATVTYSSSENRTTIRNELTGTSVCSNLVADDTCTLGNLVLTVNEVNYDGQYVNLSSSTTGASFDRLYTTEGMTIYLPVDTNTDADDGSDAASGRGEIYLGSNTTTAATSGLGHNTTSWYLYMAEQDKDQTLAAGNATYFTITKNTDNKLHVSAVSDAGSEMRVGDTDKYEYHVISDLATRIEHNRGGNQYVATVKYAGEEASADIFVSDSSVASSTSGQKTYTDTESSDYAGKNLVVVGGSCVNTVAATLLGSSSPICGDAFNSATGVGVGQYLIETFSYEGKVATLVAGWDEADTTKAATYLANEGDSISTTVGKKYIGSTQEGTVPVEV